MPEHRPPSVRRWLHPCNLGMPAVNEERFRQVASGADLPA
jgi:hypothetical protein